MVPCFGLNPFTGSTKFVVSFPENDWKNPCWVSGKTFSHVSVGCVSTKQICMWKSPECLILCMRCCLRGQAVWSKDRPLFGTSFSSLQRISRSASETLHSEAATLNMAVKCKATCPTLACPELRMIKAVPKI